MAELRAWLGWALTGIGYVIRPYDLLADRRRWFWQPRTRCGGVCEDPRAVEAVRRLMAEGGDHAE